MKSKKIALLTLLSVIFFACSQEEDKIVELPLTPQKGHGPFDPSYSYGFRLISLYSENEDKTNLKVSKLPEGLTDMKLGHIETNGYQSAYQDYLLGNITKEKYEESQKSWDWTPDTINLSKTPVKTKIAFVYGKDAEGIVKIAVDANNNLDLSDDELFVPLDMGSYHWSKADSLAQAYAVGVSFETFVHNKIVPVSVPLFVLYNSEFNIFMSGFLQYMTTQYEGKQIAVSSFTSLSYHNIKLAVIPEDFEHGKKLKEEDLYKKNEYIEIKGKIYKILGVNTNKNVLVLEKTDLPKRQLFAARVGYKAPLFEGEDLTTNSNISLEIFKGKYVLLDIWGDWCKPCIEELPHLKELYAITDRAKFEIIGIAGHSSSEGIKKLVEEHELTWAQILSDDTNKIVESYGVEGYPTAILLDTEGIIIAKNLRGDELEEKVLSLMKE